jgi:hypothetical protein
VAGTGTAGSAGDGGPAAQAQINGPFAITLDKAGNLYVGEITGNRVRKISGAAAGGGTTLPPGNSYYLSQLAFSGGWQSTLTFVNYSPQQVTCTTNFYADSGSPLSIPFSQGTHLDAHGYDAAGGIGSRPDHSESGSDGGPRVGSGFLHWLGPGQRALSVLQQFRSTRRRSRCECGDGTYNRICHFR